MLFGFLSEAVLACLPTRDVLSGWFRQSLWNEALNRSENEVSCVRVTGLVMTPRRESDAV